jgi:hypothetical protein
MDHAALTSAHPDDTLILAGPSRYSMSNPPTIFFEQLLPIGMVQSFNAMMQKPTQPMQAIGSGRNFYVSGKAQGSAQIARLFVNGRNLLRVLYTNAVQAGMDVKNFDDIAATRTITNSANSGTAHQFFMNLDSELFLIPVGLACFFRDKVHNAIGAFYMELCMINSYNIAFNAGQNMILENVALVFDRALPINMGDSGQIMNGPTESEIAELSNSQVGDGSEDIYPDLGSK